MTFYKSQSDQGTGLGPKPRLVNIQLPPHSHSAARMPLVPRDGKSPGSIYTPKSQVSQA